MIRVLYRPAADSDLFDIASYIAEDAPDRALTFVHEIRNACERQARLPLSGRSMDAIYPGLRRFVHRPYIVYYFVLPEGDGIEVAHVLHGAREHERILSDELAEENS